MANNHDRIRIFAPLRKVAEADDGTLKIYGIASSEAVDKAGEIVLAAAIKASLPGFFKHGSGALREMHASIAAGTVDSVEVDDDNITRITATVVDESSIKKVAKGVLRGLSIGGKTLARDPKNSKVITKIRLDEISLVDVPANESALLWKLAGIERADQSAPAPVRQIGFLDAVLGKVGSPPSARRLYDALAKATDDVNAMPDGDEKAAALARVASLAVDVRAAELRMMKGARA